MEFSISYMIHIRRTPAHMLAETISYNDLTFVHEGEFTYEINGEHFTVKAGEAMYCPRGVVRVRERSDEVYYTSFNFQVKPYTVLELPYHILHGDSAELRFYLKRLLQIHKVGGKLADERCSALFTLIVYTLIEQNPAASGNHYVTEIMSIIDSEPSKRYSLEELADKVYLNPSYLSELFHRDSGKTISEYALVRQLEYAAELLESGKNVRTAAEQSGFCDMYYFSRVFSKTYGITPSEYRRVSFDTGIMTDEIVETAVKSKPKGTQIDRKKSRKTH